MATIPNDKKQWAQANNSDLMGNIHITKNITFDDEGYLRLSLSPRSAMDESIDADFDNPAVILFSDDYGYFIGTWDSAFQTVGGSLSTRPTQIATAGVPSTDTQTDAVWFGGLMPVSQDTDLDYYDPVANTWTDTNISLTANGQHPIVNFLSLSALAVADVNTVKLYASPLSATPTLITTLTIPADFEITSMVYHNQNVYIGTQHVYGGHAYMFVWNGLGASAGQAYEVDSNTIFNLCVYQDTVVMLTGNGSLLQFNGAGFTLLAGFPIYYTDQSLTDEANISIYKNTMKSNGDLLYILFQDQENNRSRMLDQPDGIWCYDPSVGLHHRYSLSNSLVRQESLATSAVNTTTNEITVAGSYFTGTEVFYDDGASTSIPELVENVKYYAIRVSATVIKLASTLANATAGTAIDLTGTGNNFQKIILYPNVDYGQYWIERTTALTVIERPVAEKQFGTDVMWGAEITRRDNASDYATFGTVADLVESRGYFITPKIFSDEITDNFNLITLKFSPFTTETDKIIIKYRTYDDMKKYINLDNWDMTWTASNSFTSTETGWADAVAGDEVEILTGAGAGLLAHISTITLNAGTYTVTLDDTFANYVSGDIGKATFRNWKKWKTIEYGSDEADQYFLSEQLGAEGKFLQLKVELRGCKVRIEELSVDNKYQLPATRSN